MASPAISFVSTNTFVVGEVQTVAPPQGISPGVNQGWAVELDNFSPWVLLVTVGGKQYNLAPGMAQLYSTPSGPAALSIQAQTPPTVSSNPAGYYFVTNWVQYPDTIPGTFPVVVAPSLAGIGPVVPIVPPGLSVYFTPSNTSPSFVVSGISAFQPYLVLNFNAVGPAQFGNWIVTIEGNTTFATYGIFNFESNEFDDVFVPMFVEINPLDTAVTVTVTLVAGGAWGAEVLVHAAALPPTFGNPTGPTATALGRVNNTATPTTILAGTGNTTIILYGGTVSWSGITAGGFATVENTGAGFNPFSFALGTAVAAGVESFNLGAGLKTTLGSGNLELTTGAAIGGSVQILLWFSYIHL